MSTSANNSLQLSPWKPNPRLAIRAPRDGVQVVWQVVGSLEGLVDEVL